MYGRAINFTLLAPSLWSVVEAVAQPIDTEDLKRELIKNKLLLNSSGKCEEYINKSSVELFLNCDSKFKNKNEKNK